MAYPSSYAKQERSSAAQAPPQEWWLLLLLQQARAENRRLTRKAVERARLLRENLRESERTKQWLSGKLDQRQMDLRRERERQDISEQVNEQLLEMLLEATEEIQRLRAQWN